ALCKNSKTPAAVFASIGGTGSPYWDYKTIPAIAGLSAHSEKADIVRGAVESVAFMICIGALAIKKSGVNFDEIRAGGGMALSDYFLQFLADVLGVKISRACETESTALGVAYRLAQKAGVAADKWDFCAEKTFSPQISPAESAELIKKWNNLYEGCKLLTAKLTNTSAPQ
ncbi:MAG: FGGY-family carbohydrate kinase, partial [Elusimicrobia bacterium]|nr:FGGY-family carbohydrate kinase [Elusimicrobiota bacterium]